MHEVWLAPEQLLGQHKTAPQLNSNYVNLILETDF